MSDKITHSDAEWRARLTPEGAVTARKLLVSLYLEEGLPDRAWQAAWEVDPVYVVKVPGQFGLSLQLMQTQRLARAMGGELESAVDHGLLKLALSLDAPP